MSSITDSDKASRAYFCPRCQSPAVDTEVIANQGTCRICKHTGSLQDFFVYLFKQDMGSPAKVLNNFASELQAAMQRRGSPTLNNNLGSFTGELLFLLNKWGFLDLGKPGSEKVAKRYLYAIIRHMIKAVIVTRDEIERETTAHTNGVADA